MTREDFINREVSIWGEDYIFDLIDRGYEPIELVGNDGSKWSWKLPLLTQPCSCATLAASPSVVSPVSTD